MSEIEKANRRKALEQAANQLLGQKPLSTSKQVFQKGCANKKTYRIQKKKMAKQLAAAGLSNRKPKKTKNK